MKKMSYKPDAELKSIFGGFDFELAGNIYTIEKIDTKLFNSLTSIDPSKEETIDNVVINLIGKEEFAKIRPVNIVEILMLTEWIGNTFLKPLTKKTVGELEKNS